MPLQQLLQRYIELKAPLNRLSLQQDEKMYKLYTVGYLLWSISSAKSVSGHNVEVEFYIALLLNC